MKSEKGWANNEKNLKAILEKACDWCNSFLRHSWKEFENTPEELEESGKILGKDLWVSPTKRKTPLERVVEEVDDAPERLKNLNEVITSN